MGASLEVAAIIQERNYTVLDQIRGKEMEIELVELIDFSDHQNIRREEKREKPRMVFGFLVLVNQNGGDIKEGAGRERAGDENTRHRSFLSKSTSWTAVRIMAPSMTNINSIYEALNMATLLSLPPTLSHLILPTTL